MTAEAEQRLLAVCRAVVVQAAADAWAAHEAATTAAAAAAATAGGGATGGMSAGVRHMAVPQLPCLSCACKAPFGPCSSPARCTHDV